jgi:hypothetical protein
MFKNVQLTIVALFAATILWITVPPSLVSAKPSVSAGAEKFSSAIASVNKDKGALDALAQAVKAKDVKAAVRILRAHGFDGNPELAFVGPGGDYCICYGAPSHPKCFCFKGGHFEST